LDLGLGDADRDVGAEVGGEADGDEVGVGKVWDGGWT
jgi:hypothetical protein